MKTTLDIIVVPILNFFLLIVKFYGYVLIARAIMSFFVRDYYSNPLVNFIFRITEPALILARRFLPFLRMGMIDFSILALFLILNILQNLIIFFLNKIGSF